MRLTNSIFKVSDTESCCQYFVVPTGHSWMVVIVIGGAFIACAGSECRRFKKMCSYFFMSANAISYCCCWPSPQLRHAVCALSWNSSSDQ